jgi:hypothetical protein
MVFPIPDREKSIKSGNYPTLFRPRIISKMSVNSNKTEKSVMFGR